jgi:hypothetical protein
MTYTKSVHDYRGAGRFLLVLCILSTSLVSCKRWTERGAKGLGLLPGAPTTGVAYSTTRPANPFRQYAPGLMARTLYSVASGAGYRIEVWDLMVGPGRTADSVSLPGGFVSEVRYGGGILAVGGKTQEIRLGATFSISEGSAFRLENRSDLPLVLRGHLFTAHQPKR